MSKGLGRMQRAILTALASPRVQPGVFLVEVEGTPVWAWSIRALRDVVAAQCGAWCDGSPHALVHPLSPARKPHPPHTTWSHTGEASFSRALRRLVCLGVLQSVRLEGLAREVPSAWVESVRPGRAIRYVITAEHCNSTLTGDSL